MKTTFKNSKGEFSKENTNYTIEIEHEICSVKITRGGQAPADLSNKVKARMTVVSKDHEKPLKFREKIFDEYLNQYYENTAKWQYNRGINVNLYYYASTWREAFKEAYDYAISELNKYETLVKEREQALVNAEF